MTKKKVKSVTDGDTFVTQDDTKVRLANVRAPEEGQRGAPQARKDLRELISRKQVKVETVARDPYGRVVYSLLALPAYKTLTIVHYDEERTNFVEWFPRNPFKEDR